MHRTRRWLVVVALGSIVALALTGGLANAASDSWTTTTPSSERSTKWQQLADQVYANGEADYDALASSGQNVKSYHVAALAWYAGLRFGWQDERTELWLSRVYDRVTSSGGYGIGIEWDPYGDGTTNPADTTYGITTAWHVGRVLLDGYDAKAVPAWRVRQAVTALLDFGTAGSPECVAYSKHVNDQGEPCVWNVSAAAAWFLAEAYDRGIIPPRRGAEMREKSDTWRDYIIENYDPELGGWNYQEGGPHELDDAGHLAATVEAMLTLDPELGDKTLATYWEHYTGSASSVELMPESCDRADAGYDAVVDDALGDHGSLEENMARAAYAGVALQVHLACATG